LLLLLMLFVLFLQLVTAIVQLPCMCHTASRMMRQASREDAGRGRVRAPYLLVAVAL
jgi:hypothetical protein